MNHNADIGSLEWKAVIRDGAGKLGIEVSEEQADLFAVHAREMVRWNKNTNLTSVTAPYEMAVKHYLDSIAAVPFIKPVTSLLDVGSGGGFPGIPLKIMLPSLSVTLLDARRKRVSFLQHVMRSLGLADVKVLHDRLEQVADLLPSKSGFDVIVSRAFAELEHFAMHAVPLLNPDGCLVAYKGKKGHKLESEVAALEKLAVKSASGKQNSGDTRLNIDIQSFVLPWLEKERTFVIITCHKEEFVQ